MSMSKEVVLKTRLFGIITAIVNDSQDIISLTYHEHDKYSSNFKLMPNPMMTIEFLYRTFHDHEKFGTFQDLTDWI